VIAICKSEALSFGAQSRSVTADGWNKKSRGAEGPMEVNSTRFPSGIPALADWLHGKGKPPAEAPRTRPPHIDSFLSEAHSIVEQGALLWLNGCKGDATFKCLMSVRSMSDSSPLKSLRVSN